MSYMIDTNKMAEGQIQAECSPATKLKTEEKPVTLTQIKADIANGIRLYLNSGARVSLGRPVKLPLIRRHTQEPEGVFQHCFSSRATHQNLSQLCMRGEDKDTPTILTSELSKPSRLTTFSKPLVNRQRMFQRLKENSQEMTEPSSCEQGHQVLAREQKTLKKALPRIIRTKYIKEANRLERMKSERNMAANQPAVDMGRYELGAIVGRGSYSTVRAAKTKSGMAVAVKTYEKAKLNDESKQQNVRREVDILGRVKHPNLIKFIQAIETSSQINIVTQLIDSPSLQTVFLNSEQSRLKESDARSIFRQLIEAVCYLHDRSIVHRDIKIDNILLANKNVVKLIDFGFSIRTDKELDVFCGTPSYIAPEIISKAGYMGPPADIWSCGIVLYKLLSGSYPFKGLNEAILYSKIVKGKYKPLWGVSESATSLVSSLLSPEPSSRLTASEVLQHSWFTDEATVS